MIHVLGATGMLGRYVYTYLKCEAGFDVQGVDSTMLDAANVSYHKVKDLGVSEADVVINCIGIIPQRGIYSTLDSILVNAAFPHKMQEYCSMAHAKFIHVTTDCVFDGLDGPSDERTPHTAMDVYGRTKSLGELSISTCIRTSIIGEELRNKKSLLEWVKFNKDKTVNGYTDHYWNGITCLQFAKVCETIINTGNYWPGIRHIFSPSAFTKCQLVQLLSDIYELNVEVKAYDSGAPCDRTLSTRYMAEIKVPSLEEQIKEMRDYYPKLKQCS